MFNKNVNYTKKDAGLASILSIFLPIALTFFIILSSLAVGNIFFDDLTVSDIIEVTFFNKILLIVPSISFILIYFFITKNRIYSQYIVAKHDNAEKQRKIKLIDILISLFIPILSIVFLYPTIQLLEFFISQYINIPSVDLPIEFSGIVNYLIIVAIFCVLPAFSEELLFRKTVYSGLRSYGNRKAIILSSIIFALIHMSIFQTFYQFIIGLILAYVFYISKNIFVPIMLHFFNNFIVITVIFISENLGISESSEYSIQGIYDFAVPFFMLILGLLFIALVLRKYKRIKLSCSNVVDNESNDYQFEKQKDIDLNIDLNIEKSLNNKDLSIDNTLYNYKDKEENVFFVFSLVVLVIVWTGTILIQI